MANKSNVEKAAGVWYLLDDKARKMSDGPEKAAVEAARRNALRTLATAVKAANAHAEAEALRASNEPEC